MNRVIIKDETFYTKEVYLKGGGWPGYSASGYITEFYKFYEKVDCKFLWWKWTRECYDDFCFYVNYTHEDYDEDQWQMLLEDELHKWLRKRTRVKK